MTVAQALFADVQEIASAHWSVSVVDREDGSLLHGQFGDVQVEIKPNVIDGLPLVWVTADFARRVPLSGELVDRLNFLNGAAPLASLGVASDDEPGTVRVLGGSSTFGSLISEETICTAVETAYGFANMLLREGFLAQYGGQLTLAVFYEKLADAASLVGQSELAERFRHTAAGLHARVEQGNVGG